MVSSQEAYETFLVFWLVLIFSSVLCSIWLGLNHVVVIFMGLLSCLFYRGILADRHCDFGFFVCFKARAMNIVGAQ